MAQCLGCWKAGRLESQWLAGEPLGWLESHWGWLESQWLAGEPLVGWRATGVGWKAYGWLESQLVGWRATRRLFKAPLVATPSSSFHRSQSPLPFGHDLLLGSAVDKLDGPGV